MVKSTGVLLRNESPAAFVNVKVRPENRLAAVQVAVIPPPIVTVGVPTVKLVGKVHVSPMIGVVLQKSTTILFTVVPPTEVGVNWTLYDTAVSACLELLISMLREVSNP